MTKPATKEWVKKKRVRNFVAKKLKEDPQYRQKRIENKRKDADPLDDYEQLDYWLEKDLL